jgi:hypothetical protein
MTDDAGRVSLDLDQQEAGSMLGALAWVMGALQIMRDRGHAEADEEFHDLHDTLAPRLERLVNRISAARQAEGAPVDQAELESAYAEVRQAFEAWIQLTAFDTFSAAVGERVSDVSEGETNGEEPAND